MDEEFRATDRYKGFFQGYMLTFEGLSEKAQAKFTSLRKSLQAEVKKDASMIFVDSSYFNSNVCKGSNYYNIDFIVDSLDAGKVMDVNKYSRFYNEKYNHPSSDRDTVNSKAISKSNTASSVKKSFQEMHSKKIRNTLPRKCEDFESGRYFQRNKWWLNHPISEDKRCKVKQCTYEPNSHRVHYQPKKLLSFVEKKIIIKFLIMENRIKDAKGKSVYELMISKGYLKLRSWNTLNNVFRRTIIKEIGSYNLDPEHLEQFKQL